MKNTTKIIITLCVIVLIYGIIYSQNISSSKHNLSSGGSGTVKASTESEICIFCHTPHSSRPVAPLWNRQDPGTTYQLYSSSTLNATMNQPDGSSLMCLSCHDGTIALGSVFSRSNTISFGSVTNMPSGRSNLGSDLRDDHPFSFDYTATLSGSDAQIKDPGSISTPVHLDANGKMQCTSCHDPHKNSYNHFLVQTNEYSSLCLSCHQTTNWTNSTHKSSTRTWNSSGTNPWLHTSFNSVTTNGCESCHRPHSAGGTKRILNYSNEEDNCKHCHNGNVASKNIYGEFSKSSIHSITNYTGTHDPTESNIPSTRHVECVDCHNPHQSNATTASAPNVNGFNKGVMGISSSNSNVASVSYQYEICYRCHSSTTWLSARTTRTYTTTNTRLQFLSTNPSYHPITAAGVNTDVPSLLTGWSTNSIMYCTSCHASNDTTKKGPHGSSYTPILKFNYSTSDPGPSTYTSSSYTLCWSCHRETGTNSVRGNTTFSRHDMHIRDQRTPCNTCHDPHGVNGGNSTNNSKLINFNTAIVSTYNNQRRYVRTGYRAGYCELRCHGENHTSEMNYP